MVAVPKILEFFDLKTKKKFKTSKFKITLLKEEVEKEKQQLQFRQVEQSRLGFCQSKRLSFL